jgi:hypothetical protein
MDFQALGFIQTAVIGYSRNVHFRNHEVRMREIAHDARAELEAPELEALFDPHGPSLVCFGSNRGNHVCEKMLCKFGSGPKPFDPHSAHNRAELPFHFVWPESRSYVLKSAFHMTADDIRDIDPEAAEAVERRDAACFRYPGGCLVDELTDRDKREGRTLALCAAQRRPGDALWLLVAGLTGSATYAAAKWVRKMAMDLRPPPIGTDEKKLMVHWYLLEAQVHRIDQEGREVTYEVDDAKVVYSDVSKW